MLLQGNRENSEESTTGVFSPLALVAQIAVTLLFLGAKYGDPESGALGLGSTYNYYSGITIMMFIGFGYLMTFLKAYGLGAIGFTMLITCLGVEWALFCEQAMTDGMNFSVNMLALINAMFGVAAVLISFGGLIGKISPTQVTVVLLVEIAVYCANKVFWLTNYLDIQDCGGTIIIHVFGAYFGLACCAAYGKATNNTEFCGSDYVSDRFSLLGTVFLWIYWPSFVAGPVEDHNEQSMALINTVLALCASTVVTFAITPFLSGKKLAPVPIQNATLAGGVAIGATANLNMGPFGALVIGAIAGTISCIGFCKPIIKDDWDTCGINNLHGMPGVFGGLCSVFLPLCNIGPAVAWKQLVGLIGTLVFAIVAGGITGTILKFLPRSAPFHDKAFWDCEMESEKHEA